MEKKNKIFVIFMFLFFGYASIALAQSGILKWKFKTENKIMSSPVIGKDGTIYVGSHDEHLYAIKENGRLKWEFEAGFWVQSSPAIAKDGTIYIGSWDGYLYAIHSESGGYQLISPWPGFHYNCGRGRIDMGLEN